jgi:hypothetical protein
MLLQRATATAGELTPKHDQALSNNIRSVLRAVWTFSRRWAKLGQTKGRVR